SSAMDAKKRPGGSPGLCASESRMLRIDDDAVELRSYGCQVLRVGLSSRGRSRALDRGRFLERASAYPGQPDAPTDQGGRVETGSRRCDAGSEFVGGCSLEQFGDFRWCQGARPHGEVMDQTMRGAAAIERPDLK